MRVSCIAAVFLLVQAICGQYPGQYPPGQYPPNYPPSTYPGGQYPGNGPLAEIHLPKREAKQGTKTTVSPVDGTLRKLGGKALLLQTGPKRILRFRVLPKTQFRNKQGEPIRDSLLHPGDRLTVQANPDDEETALRVILLKSGSDAERAAAEKPVEESSIRAPRTEDLGKPRTVTDTHTAAVESQSAVETPAAPPPAEVDHSDPGGIPVEPRGSGPVSDEQVILDARETAASFPAGLPNYLADQSTGRYFSPDDRRRWQPIDMVTAEMAHVNGKEQYRNFKINGSPAAQPERRGAWGTDEFSTTLADLLSPATNAAFRRRGDAQIAGRPAVVFDLAVDAAASRWTMVSPDGRRINTAYEGAIWIDKETRRVLRLEQRTTGLPNDFPLTQSESSLEYTLVKIDERTYLLPASSEAIGCMRGSGVCTRSVIEFKNYRKFTADSNVKFN